MNRAGLMRLPDGQTEPRSHLLAEVLRSHADDVAAGYARKQLGRNRNHDRIWEGNVEVAGR